MQCRATVSSGGHPPAVLLRRDDSPRSVGAPGSLLGVLEEVELHDTQIPLDVGDTVLLYTDGVPEARRNGQFYGEPRLLKVAAGVSLLDAYLATTPGGLYAVLPIAYGSGADVAFVLAVQGLRLFAMVLAAPVVVRWLLSGERAAAARPAAAARRARSAARAATPPRPRA